MKEGSAPGWARSPVWLYAGLGLTSLCGVGGAAVQCSVVSLIRADKNPEKREGGMKIMPPSFCK